MITKKSFLLVALFFSMFLKPVSAQDILDPDIIPDPRSTRVFYSVFVQSFCDSNGDGIGDIPGLISKLDYLQDLGVGGLWLLPVHPSQSYHKYDVSDYRGIHPDYGTLDDYRLLVREAHQRGMVILLDLVINHTSNRHPWFENAASGKRSPFRNYYVWTGDTSQINKDRHHWHQVRGTDGIKKGGDRYYGFFWWEMPDLNFDEPAVRREIISIGNFWLDEIGIDGFRLDAAKYIYPEDQLNKTLAWWNEFRKELSREGKDPWIVGEIWGGTSEVAPYLKNGIDAGFNFELSDTIIASLKSGTDHGILQTWSKSNRQYTLTQPSHDDAIFLTNHDMNRIMTQLDGNMEKAFSAASLLLTLPGNPFIYYGEEIGMLGEKPDEYIREPFLWNLEGSDPGQTTWQKPWKSSSKTVKPLFFQMDDPKSLFNHYRSLAGLRNENTALHKGWTNPILTGNNNVVSFIREAPHERVLVLINLSDQIEKTMVPANFRTEKMLYSTHPVFKRSANEAYLQPYSTFIIKVH